MEQSIIDVFIAGVGPAGLQAAVHAARKKCSVLLAGKLAKSSLYRAHVENYVCVDGVKQGEELLQVGLTQAIRFGAEHLAEDILNIDQIDGLFAVTLESGRQVRTRSLVFATGTSRKKLKVPGEKEFNGRGVSYCVDCDANFYRNARVAVVGNESAAVDGALTLLGYASDVALVARQLSVSDGLRRKLAQSRVHLYEGPWVKEIRGDNQVRVLVLDNGELIEVDGVFIELGAKGAMELAVNLGVQLDQEDFTHIDTNKKQETNIAGIFAAGDIAGMPYQMAKAVGEGCVAGLGAAVYATKARRASEEPS